MEELMQDKNNNGVPDQFEYQESSDLADFKPQGNAFDNAYTSEEQIAKSIPDYKSYQWYREPNEGYFYSLGEKLENKIESGEITPEHLPEGSEIQKEAEQLYDKNPHNDEVNNQAVKNFTKKVEKNPEQLRDLKLKEYWNLWNPDPGDYYRENAEAMNRFLSGEDASVPVDLGGIEPSYLLYNYEHPFFEGYGADLNGYTRGGLGEAKDLPTILNQYNLYNRDLADYFNTPNKIKELKTTLKGLDEKSAEYKDIKSKIKQLRESRPPYEPYRGEDDAQFGLYKPDQDKYFSDLRKYLKGEIDEFPSIPRKNSDIYRMLDKMTYDYDGMRKDIRKIVRDLDPNEDIPEEYKEAISRLSDEDINYLIEEGIYDPNKYRKPRERDLTLEDVLAAYPELKDPEKLEEAIENNPRVAEVVEETLPESNSLDNEKVEESLDKLAKDSLKKANETENPLRVYKPVSFYKDKYDPDARNAYEDYVKKGDKYYDPRNSSVSILGYPNPKSLVYDTLTSDVLDLDMDLLGYEENTPLPKKLGDNKETYEFLMNSPLMQKYMNYFYDAAAALARRDQNGIEDKEGYIQRFIDFFKDTFEGGVEEAIENNPDVAEQVMEIVAGEDSPIETEAEQLNDSNPYNDEVNNKAIDENIEEKTKEIGSFLPTVAVDFMNLVNSADEGKTENSDAPEKTETENSVEDDIKKDIDNEEDLFWFEQLTRKPKKEKRADKKRKKEENKNWIENQTSEDLDTVKEDFEIYDAPATLSGNVPAEIYDNENFGGKVGPWNSAVGPARNLSDYKDEDLKVAGESWLTDDEINDIVEESSPNADEETKERRRKILRKFRLATIKANPNFPDVNRTEIKSKENPGIKSGVNRTEIKSKENPGIKSGVHPSKLNMSKGGGGAGGSASGMKISLPKEKESNYKSKTGGGNIEVEVPEKTNTSKFSGSANSIHRSEHLSQTMDKIGKSAGNIKTGSSNLSGKEGHTSSGKAGKVPSINKNLNVASIREKIIGLSKGWPMEKGYRYSGPKYLPFKFWVKDDTVELVQIGTGRHRQSLESFIKKEPRALQQLMGALK